MQEIPVEAPGGQRGFEFGEGRAVDGQPAVKGPGSGIVPEPTRHVALRG